MTLNDWKVKLIPAGALFVLYFAAPVLVQWFMGANDPILGGLTFSVLVQAALGVAIVYKLFGLRLFFEGELTAWLGRFAQPREKTREFSGKILQAAGFVSIVAVMGPPAGEIVRVSWLMTLLKVSVLGYAGYMGYGIWKLAEPFMSYVPSGEPSAVPATAAAVPERRCVKCGQLLGDSVEFCVFCHQPLRQGGGGDQLR